MCYTCDSTYNPTPRVWLLVQRYDPPVLAYFSICRYKSLSPYIGKQLYVLWLYFNKGFETLIFFKMSTYICIYLFHILVHIELREVLEEFKGLFGTMKELWKWLCIKLAPHWLIGISFMMRLFGIESPYSHNLLFRLKVALMEINPVFLLISLCISLVLGINSFYYEYSYLSIFSKVHTNANGLILLS